MSYWDDVSRESLENAKDSVYFDEGENICKISKAEYAISSSGNEMLVITFTNDSGATIKFRIVEGIYKLKMLKNLLTSFGISFDDCRNTNKWIGRSGIAVCKKDDPYNGKVYLKVTHCRSIKDKIENSTKAQPQSGKAFDDDIPF